MLRETKSTCCYCGVGCGVIIEHDDDKIVGVRGDPDHPANFGKLCSKGSTLHLTAQSEIQHQVRALYPELRRERATPRHTASWDESIDFIADCLHQCIAEHGPDSVAFYVSGQMLTEDYYVFNKFAKGLIGTNNIDSNSRLCMSSAVAAYKQSLGADAPPCSYEDIDQADCILITGSNTAYAHPILYRRLEAARANNPDLKVIVVDPRRTETAQDADLHLAIQPGTDVALMHGLLHICLWEGWIQQDFIGQHTEGFDALKQIVRNYTPAKVAQLCGIREQDLLQAARWFATAKASLSLYCQGLNQSRSGTAKNSALINLHLATGQIGRAGAGPFSLTGQPNAMGGREVGGMANLLSGHRDLSNAEDRAEVARLWNIDDVPAQAGSTAVDLFEGLHKGRIKIVWIVCTNPAQSMPHQVRIRQALERAELVIVQEAYRTTATCDYADVLLPATTWGEKSGTVTNSERRISRVRAAIEGPGETRADWQIACSVAQALAARMQKPRIHFDYQSVEEIWNEHRASTYQRDLDITGLSYQLLNARGPQQWPFPEGAQTGQARLYTDFKFATSNGKARFIAMEYQTASDKTNARFPFVLNTGRLRDQWHGMSRTGTVASLFSHEPEPCAYLAPSDMQTRMLNEGDYICLRNERGSVVLAARASQQVQSGQIFVPMHWGQESVSGKQTAAHRAANKDKGDSLESVNLGISLGINLGINTLCSDAKDPISHQPELKYAHVRIEKLELPWRYLSIAMLPRERAFLAQQTLRSYFQQFSYAHCTLLSVPDSTMLGLRFRAADQHAASIALMEAIESAIEIDASNSLRYDDLLRHEHRHLQVFMSPQGLQLRAFSLAGDLRTESYLTEVLQSQSMVARSADLFRQPGTASAPASKTICSCAQVKESQITKAAQDFFETQSENPHPQDHGEIKRQCLQSLQGKLSCGSNCGSCLPEVRRLINLTHQRPSLIPS
ncbi:molybdopterin-dependent oxidoreductase [Undibacterium cyanobacteriorum]|uniref:Molybdopterin-dependent oxidoreductase n=1 Tax=Undibacterium cyanobacteriorum TaxID=3073561 RepID=A0ABY9RGI5_9BURK|nr:molybdopterin-dependent oxidoreductase [Undibacterium sp. 20NA77.5]WMW80331.1 molybdopterin-dependent oxidoreductase [Undibacterium sp. 20NA77.5]